MFSTTTSAVSTSRSSRARPSSVLRSSVTDRLLRWRFWKSAVERSPRYALVESTTVGVDVMRRYVRAAA